MSLKKIIPLPSQEYLLERLQYNEVTGDLYWKVLSENSNFIPMTLRGIRIFNSQRSGNIAGHVFTETSGSKALQVRIDGKSYYAHRLIWKMKTGYDAKIIDHEDGDRLNNVFSNLRDVTNADNAKNCKLSKSNKSGHTGVCWSKQSQKWEAYIWKDCKKYNLGLFDDIEEAIDVRLQKEKEFNYHSNHGKR